MFLNITRGTFAEQKVALDSSTFFFPPFQILVSGRPDILLSSSILGWLGVSSSQHCALPDWRTLSPESLFLGSQETVRRCSQDVFGVPPPVAHRVTALVSVSGIGMVPSWMRPATSWMNQRAVLEEFHCFSGPKRSCFRWKMRGRLRSGPILLEGFLGCRGVAV